MTSLPKRKQLRIKDFDYSGTGAYFITICTSERRNYFWNSVGADIIRQQKIELSTVGKIVEQAISQIPDKYYNVTVDKYCIMPDHIHLILRIESDDSGRILSAPTVSTVVGSMKRWVSKQTGFSVWQKSFYDHKIRNREDYLEIWEYIEHNPCKYL